MGVILDISDDQGTIDWRELGAAKNPDGSWLVDGVIAQATEGLSITNSTYRANHDGAKTARPDGSHIDFGAYHFIYTNDNGTAQSLFFNSFIDGYQGQLRPMMDFEGASVQGHSREQCIQVLAEFDAGVRSQLYGEALPFIYFEYSLWKDFMLGYDGFSGHPSWPAAYSNDADLDMTGTGWNGWTLWQFTDKLVVPGIDVPVDASRLNPNVPFNLLLRPDPPHFV